MMRAWIGLALLAGAWLLGLDYYQPAQPAAFALAVVTGAVLLAGRPARLPGKRELGIALAMLVPAVGFMPWPYRAAPLLIAVGLALWLIPIPRRWPEPLGWGAVRAGLILLGQSLAMLAYAAQTARCHDLPRPLASLVGGIATLLGVDAAVDGTTVAMHSTREVHRLGATWDLVLDPASLCFFAGGLVMLALAAWNTPPDGRRWFRWIRMIRVLGLVVIGWLPIRAGLLIGLLVHRALRADPAAPLGVMNQFFSPWTHLLLVAGPVLLAWWFVRLPAGDPAKTAAGPGEAPGAAAGGGGNRWRYAAGPALVCAAVALGSWVVAWDPAGCPKAGRVLVEEYHPDREKIWEPTDGPYDTRRFGEPSSYNYRCIYDYCSRFYSMSRLTRPIDNDALKQCDVLVIKIPTRPYSEREIRRVLRFVEDGGGLLLIGEHTNVFRSSSYLNDLARPLGFAFRHDLLFRIGSPYQQPVRPPAVPHPAVQHLPPTELAVSCSIDPGTSRGRAVIRGSGLWSLPPDYHSENYFPQAEYRSDMRYGPFIQLWATRYGKGRVLAFTDSTVFSNFSTFEPGKTELMLGMLQWLNHRSVWDNGLLRGLLRVLLSLAAVAALAAGLVLSRRHGVAWLVLAAAGLLGWTAASAALVAFNRRAMPAPKPVRPMVRVVIDRTVSEVPLATGGFPDESGQGYGLLEQWIPRLGYFTRRATGPEAFSGDALVVICPTRSVSPEFRRRAVEYVERGGKLLVIDSPDSRGTTANSLLWPFGLAAYHAADQQGELRFSDGSPGVAVESACQVLGGEPLVWVGETPVAARVRRGEGAVMAIGFGSLFNDANMGSSWMTEPDAATRRRFDLLFALVETLVEDHPLTAAPGE